MSLRRQPGFLGLALVLFVVRIGMLIDSLMLLQSVGANVCEYEQVRMGHTLVALLPGWIALVVFDVLIYRFNCFVQLLLHIGAPTDIYYCLCKS